MSTVNVDETLYLRTIEVAKSQGKTVDAFISETLQQAVGQATPPAGIVRQSTRNGLPVMLVNGTAAAIDPQKVRESIEEEGF